MRFNQNVKKLKLKNIIPGALSLSVLAGFSFAQTPSGNVFFYSGDPGMDPDAYPYVGANVDGYLTGITVPFNGNQITFSTESTDPLTGFTPDADQVLNQEAPVASFISFNQKATNKSVAFFGDLGVYDISGVHAEPDPGTYSTPQTISFRVPNATTNVTYSINGGGDQVWDGIPFPIVEDTTITYMGSDDMIMGPVKTIEYVIDNLNCNDVDGDDIPDRIEVQIGLDPFEAQGDANKNLFNDFDELVRGATSIVPSVIPNLQDTDNDDWLDYDEDLRGTDTMDPDDKPASSGFDTVEIIVSGEVSAVSAGVLPPNSPTPDLPVPDDFIVEVITPGGIPTGSNDQTDAIYNLRTSGEQFHLIRARAQDGSGRLLLSVVPPKGLCIDPDIFCGDGDNLANWQAAYVAQYEANILHTIMDQAIDPRSTVEALLLNRYYELTDGNVYIPGLENAGPEPDLVFQLRSQRNEADLYAAIQAAVTTEMITVVTDYFNFQTSPGEFSMMEQLEMIFAGVEPDAQDVPVGVRDENFEAVGTQVTNFFLGLAEGETELTGTIHIEPDGFELDVNGTIYRLEGLADTFTDGSTITINAITDVDDCNFTQPFARVTEIVSRTPAPLMAANDTDMDDLDDDWELFNFGDLDEDGEGDNDNDGIVNDDEEENNLNPNVADSAIFISYQGDADLSLIVNAADLVEVQNNLGADYSCETCKGRGDANGSGDVASNDLDTVGDNLFETYPAADCTLIEVACNKSVSTISKPADEEKVLVSMPIMSIEGVPAGLQINDTFTVSVVVDTDMSAIRAASTRIYFESTELEVLNVSPNTSTFDLYTKAAIGDGNIDLAVLSSIDQMGELEIATIEFRALADGMTTVAFEDNPDITGIVDFEANFIQNLNPVDQEIPVGFMANDQWIMY